MYNDGNEVNSTMRIVVGTHMTHRTYDSKVEADSKTTITSVTHNNHNSKYYMASEATREAA